MEDHGGWIPCTKLGHLVKCGKVKSLEQIYMHSIPIKEHQIVSFILGPILSDERSHDVMKIQPVQKQTCAGQRIRFKAFVVIGDFHGHLGFGVKGAKEVASAIRGSLNLAKVNMVPVRRGYWGNRIGKPHTIVAKVSGKCGSVIMRLIPAPRGAGVVAAYNIKKVLQLAGIEDVYTSTKGHTATLGNFIKASYDALVNTYGFLTPELWLSTEFQQMPFQEWCSVLESKV
jgi:small subunit ribosomal protein S2e